jgi:dihydrofolate reductase
MFTMIAAIGRKGELGKGGGLVWRLSGDLKFFKEKTWGRKILMGRRTFESLPKRLPNREHFVLSSEDFAAEGVEVVRDLEDFVKANEDTEEEIFVIGGGSVYAQMLPYAKKMYLTEVDAEDAAADVRFVDFDKSEWTRTVLGEGEDYGVTYHHVLYERK